MTKQWQNTLTISFSHIQRQFLTYVTVSPSSPFGDLSAPGASLRPQALVMLTRDTVKAHGTGDLVARTVT